MSTLRGERPVAARAPGPLRAFYKRVKARRGLQVAVVATARKLAVLCWHLTVDGQDYAFARPSLVAFKQRKLALTAGAPRAHAHRGPGYDYNDKQLRRHEREVIEVAERAYETLIAGWQPRRPAHTGTADFGVRPRRA